MTNLTKSAKDFSKIANTFRCPNCKCSLRVVDLKSLKCTNNHTFDFAKEGYINLMTHSTKSHYDKSLFEARQKIIRESKFYELLHKKISKVIKGQINDSTLPFFILDAGCGEGSHLHKILAECTSPAITGIGLDISKDGIRMAAKKYKEPIWMVSDLAQSPIDDQSIHVILNILSPSNYKEFTRVLIPSGLVIKVVPRPNYLIELREALSNGTNNKTYKNDDTVNLFKKHFHLKEVINVSYQKKLTQEEVKNIVQMSPLSWKSEKTAIEAFVNGCSSEITIDLDILIGLNK